MRVLFATDGSRSAAIARDLIASLAWPAGTRIRVVSVLEGRSLLARVDAGPFDAEAFDDPAARHLELALDETVEMLERADRPVDRIVLEGRPASAILEEARGYGAELIVLGSHGHSRIATMLLGSTSAEVVARAHCPVLVAREKVIEEIVLGADTSAAARQAEAVVAWPTFCRYPTAVVSVAPAHVPWVDALPGAMSAAVIEAEEYESQLALSRALGVANLAADRLERAGVSAEAHALSGDAAAELVGFAMTRPHALLAVGSRAHGGISKLLLGGVARNVLQHAAGSVLVVPETAPVRNDAAARDALVMLSALGGLA